MKTIKLKSQYFCPDCLGNVCVSDKIILKIGSINDEYGLVMLSANISDYSSEVSESIKMVEGYNYKFYCPLCSKCLNLESTQNRLIKLLMKDKEVKKMHEVYFSGIFGENCTYIVNDSNLEYFGKHSKKYIDQIDKYKEYYENHL